MTPRFGVRRDSAACTMAPMRLWSARAASVVLVSALVLSGCGGDDKDKADEDPTESPTTSTTGPTEPGTELELGQSATFAWSPNQRLTSTVAVTVTRIDQGPKKDVQAIKVDPPLKDPKLYYVHVRIENQGSVDLGGVSSLTLPLYVDDGSDVLMPAADVRLAFTPCPLEKLPAAFGSGAKKSLCLVYVLETTELQNLSLRASDTAPAITWTGPITEPVKPKTTKKKKKS
jgi:hypothetical protein